MTFPTVTSKTETTDTTASPGTNAVLNYPATVNEGALALVFVEFSGNQGSLTFNDGVTKLDSVGGTGSTAGLGFRICDGTEGGGTVTVSRQYNGNESWCGQIWIIDAGDWHGVTPPEISTAAAAFNTTGDPGAVTASWGTEDNLFITFFGWGNDQTTISAAPSGYSNELATVAGAAENVTASCSTFTKESTAATDDPGSVTFSGNSVWRAWTVVVRGPAASGPTITDVNTTESWNDGDTGIVITGTGFTP